MIRSGIGYFKIIFTITLIKLTLMRHLYYQQNKSK